MTRWHVGRPTSSAVSTPRLKCCFEGPSLTLVECPRRRARCPNAVARLLRERYNFARPHSLETICGLVRSGNDHDDRRVTFSDDAATKRTA